METVTVRREALLDAVRKNRETHRDLFLKAQEGFRARVIEELDRRLADARAGKAINLAFQLPTPIDQTSDYDRVIRMMEMSIHEAIELSEHEFAQYVMDDWAWKKNVTVVNSMYTR